MREERLLNYVDKEYIAEATTAAKDINSALDKVEKFEGTVYRGVEITNKKVYDKLINQLNNDKIFIEKGFLSTTTDKIVAKEMFEESQFANVHYNIKSKTGRLIEEYSSSPREKEVLFKSNSKFKIKSHSVKIVKGIKTVNVFLEEL